MKDNHWTLSVKQNSINNQYVEYVRESFVKDKESNNGFDALKEVFILLGSFLNTFWVFFDNLINFITDFLGSSKNDSFSKPSSPRNPSLQDYYHPENLKKDESTDQIAPAQDMQNTKEHKEPSPPQSPRKK